MSVQAIAWALDVRTGKATAKCVLVALANYADENGVCWPSQVLIARQTEMSVDSVQRRLRDLEAKGLIVRERTITPARYKESGEPIEQIPEAQL